MNYEKAKEAYLNDPLYKNMVDCLYRMINELQLSPSEIREAAMLACIMFEERKTNPSTILEKNNVPQ
jgi:hypothetical protein